MSTLPLNSEFGSYFIVRHIGGGGMAQIYQAKHSSIAGFEKHVALKVINPEYANEQRFIQMLIDEAKITVGLSHVNIAQVFDLGQCNGIYYIVMEFVDGVDVLELVNGLHGMGRRLPVEAVAYMGRQVCSGLHYAHMRKDKSGKPLNIVHRDISPQNILVSRAGEVKVVDFGIAKAAGMSSKTQAGVIKGKVNYMAPEQVMGQKADRRTDLFSVGVVLWESLTAQMVYSAENMGELVAAVRKADIPPPSSVRPDIPPLLDSIVMRALHSNTKERFQSAHELQVELTKFLSSHAPDYSGTDISQLVEHVLDRKGRGSGEVDADLIGSEIRDRNSLIFSPDVLEPVLIVMRDEGPQEYPIGPGLTIGRAGELPIADARVSRQHARLDRRQDAYVLTDLGSSNGTFVNNDRLKGPRTLNSGDRIRIGGVKIRFLTPATMMPAPSAPNLFELNINGYGQKQQQLLSGETQLRYSFQVGPIEVTGTAGRVVERDGGFWLEPQKGRLPIAMDGKELPRPIKLSPGDTFQVGTISFTFSQK